MKLSIHALWRRIRGRSFAALLFCSPLLALAAASPDGFSFVDLSRYAVNGSDPAARQFSALPRGAQKFNSVPFNVDWPLAVTGVEAAHTGDFFPSSVTGIPVGRAAKRIHVLHATSFAERDGAPLANIVFRYSNGSTQSVRLGYGVHTRAWIIPRLEKRGDVFDPNSREAWSETEERRDSGLRLFQTAIENPKPGETIASLDVVSLFSHATPLIAAITVEGAESKLPANLSRPLRKAARDLADAPDSVFRSELSVRVTDAESGAPLTNAIATLSITDDKESFYFGSASADARGMARLAYPPPHAAGVSIWVHAPGRMPEVVTEFKTNLNRFTSNYTVALKRGATIGGVVKGADGKPITGAQVIVHRVKRISPHHYSRTDYDTAMTGADGKWSSQSAPDDLTGFSFQIEHADFRPAHYATEGYAPPPTNSSSSSSSVSSTVTYRSLPDGTLEPITTRRVTVGAGRSGIPLVTASDLKSGSAAMTLQPAILIAGTAFDSKNNVLTNTEVVFQQNNPFYERKYLRTDAQGRFRTMASAPGNGTLNLVLPGQSPASAMVSIAPEMPPVELRLSPPRVLRGQVQDRNSRPIAGAKVRVDDWQGTTDLVRFQTFTDEKGTFVWTGAPADRVTFFTSKTNFVSNRNVSSGTNNVTITLTRPSGIYGKVFDAETKRPVESFTVVPGRKYSPNEARIHWERSEAMRGSGGEYSLRISSYYFQPEARVLVEAPGYEPQISRAFSGVDSHTNDFALKRGKGINGVVLLPDGSPATGAALVIVQKDDSGYLDNSGQVRLNSGGSDMVRSDAQGRFEFTPKLEPDKIYVTHAEGFGEAKAADVAKNGQITLRKWGRVAGVSRVGDAPEPGSAVNLSGNPEWTPDADGRSSSFYFSFRADLDATGNFAFERVPPGEQRLSLEYRFKEERYGETPLSHGFLVNVKPGETASAELGGTGRRVTGRVKLTGGDHSDVDWRRDVHRLTLALPPLPGQVFNNRAQAGQPLIFLDSFNGAIPVSQPIDPAAMRERQRAERTYVLIVETNGNFRAENVPPGKYMLTLNVTDPEEEYYNRRSIGAMNKEIVVPDEKDAKVNAPFDIGAVDLTIRPRLRVGKVVPSFEGKTSGGKTVKLSDYRGKPVLLHFWGQSLGYNTTEFNILKELQASYGQSGKLVILGCNLDGQGYNPEQFVQRQAMTWTQLYLGQWDQTPIPGMFGLNGSSGAVFIDAEGKLASGVMRSTLIRNTINNALAE